MKAFDRLIVSAYKLAEDRLESGTMKSVGMTHEYWEDTVRKKGEKYFSNSHLKNFISSF